MNVATALAGLATLSWVLVIGVIVLAVVRAGQGKPIRRTSDASPPSVEYMGVDHGRTHVRMTKQFLDRPDVVPILEEVRREGVAECMAGGRLADLRPPCRFPHGLLQYRLVQVMPPSLPGFPVDVEPGRREDPLPGRFAARVRVLPAKRCWKFHPSCAPRQIPLVLRSDNIQVAGEVHLCGLRKQCDSVLVPFPFADDDLVR